jgi:hypothetical protein
MSRAGRTIGWIAGTACVACCAAPFIAAGAGTAGLAGLAAHFELAAIGAAAMALTALLIWRLKRRSAPACKIDGTCRQR